MKAMTPSEHAAVSASRAVSALDRLLRKRLIAGLSRLTGGRLAIEDSLGSETLGDGAALVRLTCRGRRGVRRRHGDLRRSGRPGAPAGAQPRYAGRHGIRAGAAGRVGAQALACRQPQYP
ncbi:hypothetical protein G6F24_017462 [Rhizopus arrhizus]|nr:hypothetical protein G6F24_017462 [Rhizopus arrhizus]